MALEGTDKECCPANRGIRSKLMWVVLGEKALLEGADKEVFVVGYIYKIRGPWNQEHKTCMPVIYWFQGYQIRQEGT